MDHKKKSSDRSGPKAATETIRKKGKKLSRQRSSSIRAPSLQEAEPSLLQSVPGPRCSRCGAEGFRLSLLQCLRCLEVFCESCGSLKMIKNPCEAGLFHCFSEKSQSARGEEFSRVGISFDYTLSVSEPFSVAQNFSSEPFSVGQKSLDPSSLSEIFSSNSEPKSFGQYQTSSIPSSSFFSHISQSSSLSSITSEILNRSCPDSPPSCSRCSTSSVPAVSCSQCQQTFCSTCQKLKSLKNPCSNGLAHQFFDQVVKTESLDCQAIHCNSSFGREMSSPSKIVFLPHRSLSHSGTLSRHKKGVQKRVKFGTPSPSFVHNLGHDRLDFPLPSDLPIYHPNDTESILSSLVSLYPIEKLKISQFLSAFGQFKIDQGELFDALMKRYSHFGNDILVQKEAMEEQFLDLTDHFDIPIEKQVKEPPKNLPTKSESETVGSALRYILREWMTQSAAMYERKDPKFFRAIITHLSGCDDPTMNEIKLIMLRQTSMKKIDPKTPPLSPSQKELPKEGFRSFLFQQYSIEDISIAITYLMFQVFKLIAPSELHDGAWQGEKRKTTAPNLRVLNLIFNRISFLCLVEILYAESNEQMIEAFGKCAELGNALLKEKLGNFEGMAAVASIFASPSILHIKPLWKQSKRKVLKTITKLEAILQPTNNYHTYWVSLHSYGSPTIPWFAPKLRELRYLYDGNLKILSNGNVDDSFLQKCGKSIHSYLRFNSVPYNFSTTPDPELVNFLKQVEEGVLSDLVEDEFYAQSQKIIERLQ